MIMFTQQVLFPEEFMVHPKFVILKKSDILPLMHILLLIHSCNYNLASCLCELSTPFINSVYFIKDSFTFIKDVQVVSIQDKFMVSYHVYSLSTNISQSEKIDIAVKLILENKKLFKFKENQLLKLFCCATSGKHFYFDEKIFDQVDRVAMSSPLGSALANFFIGYNE